MWAGYLISLVLLVAVLFCEPLNGCRRWLNIKGLPTQQVSELVKFEMILLTNVAVVTNTLPNTGISLPFFSSGGTSLLLLMAEMGVMIHIGRNGARAAQARRAAHEARQEQAQRAAARPAITLDSVRRPASGHRAGI